VEEAKRAEEMEADTEARINMNELNVDGEVDIDDI